MKVVNCKRIPNEMWGGGLESLSKDAAKPVPLREKVEQLAIRGPAGVMVYASSIRHCGPVLLLENPAHPKRDDIDRPRKRAGLTNGMRSSGRLEKTGPLADCGGHL